MDIEVLRLNAECLHDFELIIWVSQTEIELLQYHGQRHCRFLHSKCSSLYDIDHQLKQTQYYALLDVRCKHELHVQMAAMRQAIFGTV